MARLGYTGTKLALQAAGMVRKAPGRIGAPRARTPGMMLHQDGSRHEWMWRAGDWT